MVEGQNNFLSFVSAEMQGNFLLIEVGEKQCRMQPFTHLILEMEIHFLLSSMATEVNEVKP